MIVAKVRPKLVMVSLHSTILLFGCNLLKTLSIEQTQMASKQQLLGRATAALMKTVAVKARSVKAVAVKRKRQLKFTPSFSQCHQKN